MVFKTREDEWMTLSLCVASPIPEYSEVLKG